MNNQEMRPMKDTELLKSFDARVWAAEFVKHVAANPGIATDEETMTTWFANALMRGYEEYYWHTEKYNWKHWILTDAAPGKEGAQ